MPELLQKMSSGWLCSRSTEGLYAQLEDDKFTVTILTVLIKPFQDFINRLINRWEEMIT